MEPDLEEILENEWYLVRHSGETPEIALHSALYYLTRAKDGPHLDLDAERRQWLQAAALTRFAEIIVRDLLHDNRHASVYRGPARSIVNYSRFIAFCSRQGLDAGPVRQEAAAALRRFLGREVEETGRGCRTLLNCTFRQLSEFAAALGVEVDRFREHLAPLCIAE